MASSPPRPGKIVPRERVPLAPRRDTTTRCICCGEPRDPRSFPICKKCRR